MSDDPHLTWVPEACTLPTAEQPLRRAEFDDLFADADAVERVGVRHARVALTGSARRADEVRDLAARENDCCAFFTFTVTAEPADRIVFAIEVPAGHVEVLDALLDRAAHVRAGR